MTLQTAPVAALTIITHAAVAPAPVAHHTLILLLSFLMLLCIVLSLLLLKILRQNARFIQDSNSSDDYYVRANPVTLRLKTGNR